MQGIVYGLRTIGQGVTFRLIIRINIFAVGVRQSKVVSGLMGKVMKISCP